MDVPSVEAAAVVVSANCGERSQRGHVTPGESPRQIRSGKMAAAPLAIAFPVGRHRGAATLLHGLGVKTRSSYWTSDGDACGRRNLLGGVVSRDTVWFDVVAGLLFGTAPPVMTVLSLGVRQGGLSTPRHDVCSTVGDRGLHSVAASSACSVSQCLVLLRNLQCGAGQRCGTACDAPGF
jgi:hypothetical protein